MLHHFSPIIVKGEPLAKYTRMRQEEAAREAEAKKPKGSKGAAHAERKATGWCQASQLERSSQAEPLLTAPVRPLAYTNVPAWLNAN